MDFVLEKTTLGLYNHPYVIKKKRRKSKCFLVGACHVTCMNIIALFLISEKVKKYK